MPERTALLLLLSSEPVVRKVVSEALETAGYVVRATGDLGSAVDLLAASPVDLLITHPYVEGIPGHQAARYLREKHPAMKILIVAGVPDDDRIFIRAGLEHFEIFPAPFSAAELVATVDAILASRDAA
jgi:DNA-binding response OmpR family regulator